jgi:hypothetical protein
VQTLVQRWPSIIEKMCAVTLQAVKLRALVAAAADELGGHPRGIREGEIARGKLRGLYDVSRKFELIVDSMQSGSAVELQQQKAATTHRDC